MQDNFSFNMYLLAKATALNLNNSFSPNSTLLCTILDNDTITIPPSITMENSSIYDNFAKINPVMGNSVLNGLLATILLHSIFLVKLSKVASGRIPKHAEHMMNMNREFKTQRIKLMELFRSTFTLEGAMLLFVFIVLLATVPLCWVFRLGFGDCMGMHPGFQALEEDSLVHWAEAIMTTGFIFVGRMIANWFERIQKKGEESKKSTSEPAKKEVIPTDEKKNVMAGCVVEAEPLPEKREPEDEKKLALPPEEPQRVKFYTFGLLKKSSENVQEDEENLLAGVQVDNCPATTAMTVNLKDASENNSKQGLPVDKKLKEVKKVVENVEDLPAVVTERVGRTIQKLVNNFTCLYILEIFIFLWLLLGMIMLRLFTPKEFSELNKFIDLFWETFLMPFVRSIIMHCFFLQWAVIFTLHGRYKNMPKGLLVEKILNRHLILVGLILCWEVELLQNVLKVIFSLFGYDVQLTGFHLHDQRIEFINYFLTANFVGYLLEIRGYTKCILQRMCCFIIWSGEKSIAIIDEHVNDIRTANMLFTYAVGITMLTLYPPLSGEMMFFYCLRNTFFFAGYYKACSLYRASPSCRAQLLKLFQLATSIPHFFYTCALLLNYGFANVTLFSFVGMVFMNYFLTHNVAVKQSKPKNLPKLKIEVQFRKIVT